MIISGNIKYLNEILVIENMSFSNPWNKNQIKSDLIKLDSSENLIYLNNNKVIAYILGRKILDEFHLNNIAVHRKFQRKNVATKLIRTLINRLKIQDIKKIFLEVSEKNNSAIKLYESFKFVKQGIRKQYYCNGDNAILYCLEMV